MKLMASILDNKERIIQLDSGKMRESIAKVGDQIMQIKKEVDGQRFPSGLKNLKKIVVAGMGGSTIGAHCIRSVFSKQLRVPFEIVNGYEIPGTVDKNTLVFAISYSGNTEETVAALQNSLKAKAKTVVISTGGKLQQISQKKKLPALIFATTSNPCGSPRMGLGYTMFGPLFILSKLGYVKLGRNVVNDVLSTINKFEQSFGLDSYEDQNKAKQLAAGASTGNVWYVAAGHLSGNAHVVANQTNENAKRFAGYFLIPELNHHLLEGLSFPKDGKNFFLFIESDLYNDRVQKRFYVTKEILQKNNIPFATYKCEEKDALQQMAEVLVLGSYLSFYTAMLEGIDPTAIPVVDYLKAALKS